MTFVSFMSEPEIEQLPPHLPPEPENFFRAGPDVDLLISVAPPESPKHVLEQLGPPPFRKTAFPMMGFLASVYEHVAAHVAGRETST
jgi:hypothetical protein